MNDYDLPDPYGPSVVRTHRPAPMLASPLFGSPFSLGHCIVMSLAHLKDTPTPEFATDLARWAYQAPREPYPHEEDEARLLGHSPFRLLDPVLGGGYALRPRDADAWLAQSGLRALERVTYDAYWDNGAPTLEVFAREHPVGRWFIGIPGHATALRDGMLFGALPANLHEPVMAAIRVEEVAQ